VYNLGFYYEFGSCVSFKKGNSITTFSALVV
jgi:hypothetical protein